MLFCVNRYDKSNFEVKNKQNEVNVVLNDNIQKYRKAKGMSQEELAVGLHVVRQTVSKWEKGLSVPDAQVLIDMAALLDVSVNALLGIDVPIDNSKALAEELARVNALLAKKNQREGLLEQASKKRGGIILLTFLAMFIMLAVNNSLVSLVLSGACLLMAVGMLYRNLALLTSVTTDDMRLGVLRLTTLVNIGILVVVMGVAALIEMGVLHFSEASEKLFAMILVTGIIVFTGIVSPKLPFTRHTGLRLPWTVSDEDTWNVAHRIIGIISVPLAVLYIACALTLPNFETVTVVTVLLWIAIPGGLSYLYYWKKMHGRV